MKSFRLLALGLAALAVTALVLIPTGAKATDGKQGTPVTMEDFLRSYAKAQNIDLPATASGDQVLAALKANGVKIEDSVNLSKTLTQGDVAKIGKENGLRITSTSPDKAFSSDEMDQFFTSYGLNQTSMGADEAGWWWWWWHRKRKSRKSKKSKKKSPRKCP
jgi:hypothetical protein